MLTAAMLPEKTGLGIEEVERLIERAKRSLVPTKIRIQVTEDGRTESLNVERNGVGPLQTKFGNFEHFDFSIDDKWGKYSVLVKGDLTDDFMPSLKYSDGTIRLRIDSGCETGQMFGDKTCECRDQLDLAMERLHQIGEGMIINIPAQDGRGLRLPHKLASLRLSLDLDVDTVEAGDLLVPGGSKDIRTYAGVVAILKFFGIGTDRKIVLFSNNEKKRKVFSDNGYEVQLEEIVIPPTEFTRKHLEAKQKELGHLGLIPDGE